MGSRGKKRSEVGEVPGDKRACSSVRRDAPGTENLSQSQAAVDSVSVSLSSVYHNGNMNTDQTGTSYSDRGHAHNIVFGSSDSGVSGDVESVAERNALADYGLRQFSGQPANLLRVISILGKKDVEESGLLAALTDLCGQLSFVERHLLPLPMVESLSPILVSLAKHETNPNIMLLAIRAVTYTCDVIPHAALIFVKHEAIPALSQRLIAIEYLDVAEQCLQALDKISLAQPLACLQSGVIMAALAYIDFFSSSIQRVALSIVVNICRKLPPELPSPLIEALPTLCNLLQYEDRQVVEKAATCLIKITAQVSISSELLNEICNHGVVNQIISIIDMNTRSTRAAISQTVYNGLIGLLSKLACGPVTTFKTLFELNISVVLRDILLSNYPSSGLPFITSGGGNYNQIQEVMKLLNELLPGVDGGRNTDTIVSDKKSFLVGQQDILRKLGINILPHLIQVVNMGADMHIDYCCLSFIYKLVYFTKAQLLLELLQNLNISSFLSGVFTRKDPHFLLLALKISKTILQKQYDNFMNSFVKDGVFFAIEALLKIELSSQFTFTMTDGAHVSNDHNQRATKQEVRRCLCYALSTSQPSKSSPCNIKLKSVNDLAKRIKLKYFPKKSVNSDQGLTEIHQELKALSSKLIELLKSCKSSDDGYPELDDEIQHLLSLILKKLNGSEPVSTFEFIESGVIQALLTFLSHDIHMSREPNNEVIISYLHKVDNRFQIFARLSMFLLGNHSKDQLLLMLVRKLQSALSTVENFPVILGQPLKLESSIAFVPDNLVISHPTFKVQFLKGEGEENLTDYSSDYVTVDPFASLKYIEEHLWQKVCTRKNESVELSTQGDFAMEGTPANDGVVEGSSSDNEGSPNLSLYLGEQKLDLDRTLYQAILHQRWKPDYDSVSTTKFWTRVYSVTYRSVSCCEGSSMDRSCKMGDQLHVQIFEPSWLCASTIFKMFDSMIASDMDQMSPSRDVLYLIKILECINSNIPNLPFKERAAIADDNIEKTNSMAPHGISVPQKEFVNNRLTEKLEQQMHDPAAITIEGLPSWWNQLVMSCPFLFAFDTRCKYFHLSVIGLPLDLAHGNSRISSDTHNERRRSSSGLPREKFLAIRDNVLESASKMMEQHSHRRSSVVVQFDDEVGTGLGPTLEFYTLVSHEFQRSGMGLWREDSLMQHQDTKEVEGIVVSRFGLFPRPWYCPEDGSEGTLLSEVITKFALLGQIVAKALHDGRVLDLHLSKAFYKIILGKKLDLYDIQSFDPELGRALQDFKATAQKNLDMTKMSVEILTSETVACLHTAEIEDLTLDFSLPGYPDYLLDTEKYNEMVTIGNLDEYVSLVVDATLNTGIYRQVEAFEAGFNQVFPIQYTYIFNEEELERLLCGEQNFVGHPDELLNCIKFDHGYTASSTPILDLLEILQEFDHEQQRAFVQFVTGTPRLPPGGLASLNPRLTIVRKHSDNFVDDELPSAMTCANYLKLPPYSSKAIMKEKLVYAISEGQGSFHLS